MTDTTTSTSLPLAAGTWALDPTHSEIGFTIRHIGISKVRGRFTEFDASLVVGDGLDSTTVTAHVAVASINTGNKDRDTHVLAPDVLDVSRRPTLAFRSTGIEGEGDDWTMTGDLTIGDVTRPVTLEVELGGVGDYIDGSRHAGFEARTQVSRKDFGIDFGPLNAFLGDTVKIELDMQFVEPS
jgi:polyisoprenoid-binding protein YceI